MTELSPIVARRLARHAKDYARLSATPDQFKAFVNLHSVSHFAPLQRPEQFNSAMPAFLGKVLP